MGLDWCLKRKVVDGKEVTPYESLGAKRLDKSDPETIEAFRAVWESHQDNVKQRREAIAQVVINVGAGTIEKSVPDKYLEYWSRPFEVVLDEVEPEHPVLPDTVKGEEGKSPCSGIAVSDLDLRGKVVSGCLSRVGENKMADRCYEEFTPDEMRTFANQIEKVKFKDSKDKEFMERTVTWLRFWAEKGHGVAPWY